MTVDPESLDYRISLELPAVHRGIRMARNVVRRFARMWGMAHAEVDVLILVASELLANAVDHGGGGAAMTEVDLESDVRMRMCLTLENSHWTLEVSDQGAGKLAEVQGLIEPEGGMPDLEDERGRGFLLAQMVDRLAVEESADGAGLTITASKRHA